MGKNSKKRKSSSASTGNGSFPSQPSTPLTTHYPDNSTTFRTSPSSSHSSSPQQQQGQNNNGGGWLTSIAAIVLAVLHIAEKHNFKPLQVTLFAAFILGGIGLGSYYILWPFAKFLLDYPLAPFRWILVKGYYGVSWVTGWITWILKGAAWCAFYLHFLNKFVEGLLWGLEKFLEPIKEEEMRKCGGHSRPQSYGGSSGGGPFAGSPGFAYPSHSTGQVEESDDDDGPPPLIPADDQTNSRIETVD
ncbi:hypothetical protein DL96DRAFT_344534 [Flagelloscypha sp. PMI_526]|nr:hypothetical protein DL96DRAFT_344534 [Flagelloscypha sp. PMI_526]